MYDTPPAQLTLLPICRQTMVRSPMLSEGLLPLRLTHPPQPPSDDGAGAEAGAEVPTTGDAVAFCATTKRSRMQGMTLVAASNTTARMEREREGNLWSVIS
jgi:hypothetical protein